MGDASETSQPFSFKAWAVCVGSVLAVVAIWGTYTQHAWEDFYISFRASQNLASGNGLVFQVGERLHTFTSPLHTLLLAGLAFVARTSDDPALALWLYRLVGGVALGSAIYLVLRLGRTFAWPRVALVVGVGLVACDPKSLDFTVAGMEAPLLLFFFALNLHALLTGAGWRQLGLAWAGMMWTRPDAFIFIGAALGGMLVFGCADRAQRRALLGQVWRAALVCTALYGPWLIWAQFYYGSPIPHTIVAKGLVHHARSVASLVKQVALSPFDMLVNGRLLPWIYSATYTRGVWDWGEVFHAAWRLLAWPAWLYWLNPWGGRQARGLSLAFFLATLYAVAVPFAPWYAPPYVLVASVAWGFIFVDLWRCTEPSIVGTEPTRQRRLQWAVAGLAVVLVGAQVATSAIMARTMRLQQQIIETGMRREIGRWLRAQAQPGDRVFLECVGYIGYFSGLKMLDFPGLTSREVIAARQKLKSDSYALLIRELEPEWLVLRKTESDEAEETVPGLLKDSAGRLARYERVQIYDRTAEVAALPRLRGRLYLELDQHFEIYRRRGGVTEARSATRASSPR